MGDVQHAGPAPNAALCVEANWAKRVSWAELDWASRNFLQAMDLRFITRTIWRFFIFIFFKKKYRNIFLVSDFTVLYPYRPTWGQQGAYRPAGGGMDLYVNKKNLRSGPWREPAAPLPGSMPPAAPPVGGRGAAGSHPKYKTPLLPSAPSFSAHEIQRGERERGGVREVIPPAKPCRILDPNRR